MNEPATATTPADPSAPTRLPARALLLLILVVLMWGASYPTMKAAALEFPLAAFRGLTGAIPGALMLLIAKLMGVPLSVPKECRVGLLILAGCTVTFMHTVTTISTLYIAAGQTSLMLYTMPIWAAIIAIPVLGERPTRGHWIGVALGLSGIALLWSQTSGGGLSPGVLLGVIAAIAWAVGTVSAKSISGRLHPLVMTGWSFFLGALPLCLYGLTQIDEFRPVSPLALWSAVFIAFGANFIGFLTFYYIIRMVPAVVASLSVLAVPGVAFALGLLLLGEPMTAMDALAFLLIAGALTTVLPKPTFRRSKAAG